MPTKIIYNQALENIKETLLTIQSYVSEHTNWSTDIMEGEEFIGLYLFSYASSSGPMAGIVYSKITGICIASGYNDYTRNIANTLLSDFHLG